MKCCSEVMSEVLIRPRRSFLRFVALGAGVGLWAVNTRKVLAQAQGSTDVLLLSCMDFRLMDDIERYMNTRGLRSNYDHIVLAGASLGAMTKKYPAWKKTFWQHLEIAIQLHQVQTVIVMDHRDCGAYKVILGDAHTKDKSLEKTVHAEQMRGLSRVILERYPRLKVETLLMGLDGQVEIIV